MKGTKMLVTLAAGAVVGTCAAAAVHACTSTPKGRRKLNKCKNNMFKTVGTMVDAVMDYRH